jgi:hypothetical protein
MWKLRKLRMRSKGHGCRGCNYEEDELDGITCKLEDVDARNISLTIQRLE